MVQLLPNVYCARLGCKNEKCAGANFLRIFVLEKIA